jgi:hypothetical protein
VSDDCAFVPLRLASSAPGTIPPLAAETAEEELSPIEGTADGGQNPATARWSSHFHHVGPLVSIKLYIVK